MAYNNGFPINYQQMYPQYGYISQQPITPVVQSQPVANDNGIIWVQGENAAKSYPVGPNTAVALWDSE